MNNGGVENTLDFSTLWNPEIKGNFDIIDFEGFEKFLRSMWQETLNHLAQNRIWFDPFSVHTTGIYVLQAASITEVAARVVASYSVDISLQITQNGRLIDPRVTVNQCSEQIFRFRATGLAGGAKANDDVTRALEAALTARGVPADVVQSRITLIMNKIPPKDIRPDIHLDTDAFWTRLKFMANEAKVRLITSQELKEHQKKSRAEKKHSNAITPAP